MCDVTSIILGLGSNRGDSRQIILDAMEALKGSLAESRCSSLYKTDPLYVTEQGKFINAAVSGFFCGSARELLVNINEIETRFGRDRSRERRWGERFLDIDILLFGKHLITESDLEIPHPRLKERRFALEPLLELIPDAVEPGTGLSYRAICDALPDQGVIALYSKRPHAEPQRTQRTQRKKINN